MASDFTLTNRARFVKARDSLNNLIRAGGTVAGVVSGLTSNDVNALLSACDLADTMGELGLSGTAIATSMQVDRVTAIPMGSDKALTLTDLGPQNFLTIRKKSTQMSWSVPFTLHVDRYLKATGSAITTSGQAVGLDASGRPNKVRIPVPCAKIYDLTITESAPYADEAAVGTFSADATGISAEVLRHFNDTKEFDLDTGGKVYYDIEIREFRSTKPVNGWHIYSVNAKNETVVTDITAI